MLIRTRTLPSASQSLSDAAASLQAAAHAVQATTSERLVAARSAVNRSALSAQAYVHENPWRIAGAAAGLGLLAGVLLGAGRRHP